MQYSYISHLHCSKCDRTYPAGKQHGLCQCGAPLLVAYDLKALKADLNQKAFESRPADLWRYHELLPVANERDVVSLGEGMTPLLTMDKLGQDMGINHLLMKDEGIIPTGTFKARGATVGVSMAKQLGVKSLAMPTNGNAGSAWSLYAARAGISAKVVMPESAPKITRNEVAISGADLYLVKGLISDAGKIVGRAIKNHHYYDTATLKEPYRIEGKKTMGIEIAEQLDWQVPDVILYPTGGGVGLIGIYKALRELQTLGWIDQRKMPRLVAVQSTGCAPIVKAWQQKKTESQFWEHSETIAFGINVPKALGDFLVLEALYQTDGYAIAVDDVDILVEQKKAASMDGAFVCPEGAATFAAARQLRLSGWIKPEETVVALNTGAGIKYPDTFHFEVPTLLPDEDITVVKNN